MIGTLIVSRIPTSGRRPHPVGLYWLAAGLISLSMWAGIILIAIRF